MQGICKKAVDKRLSHPKINRNIDSLPGEIWKDLIEWRGFELQPGYQASNLGRIRNLGRTVEQIGRNGKIIKHPYPACMLHSTEDSDGYLVVGLSCPNRKVVDARVHQVVARLFLTEQPRPDQTHVNHKDGNKHNNSSDNLEWASPAENNKHARDTGLARLGTSQAIRCKIIETGVIYASKTKADAGLGKYFGYIDHCLLRNNPIIDTHTGGVVHIEFIYPKEVI